MHFPLHNSESERCVSNRKTTTKFSTLRKVCFKYLKKRTKTLFIKGFGVGPGTTVPTLAARLLKILITGSALSRDFDRLDVYIQSKMSCSIRHT